MWASLVRHFLSLTLCSVCLECVRGKKSSTCGIRQFVLQQLRHRWGRKQDRVCVFQWDGHHGNHHHWYWEGDHPAHSGRQKWEGRLYQVCMLTHKRRSVADSCRVPSSHVVLFLWNFPHQTFFSHTASLLPSLFILWYRLPPVCFLLSHLQLTPEYSDQQSDGMLYFRSFTLECGMLSWRLDDELCHMFLFACCIYRVWSDNIFRPSRIS